MSRRSLGPVINEGSRVLILGTMPGDESLRKGQYYANPRNQFWTILERVYGEPVGSNYSERVAFLYRKGLALWDVLQDAERKDSTDRAITNPVANDLRGLLAQFTELRAIVFNGGNAAEYFSRLLERTAAPGSYENLQRCVLPSSSPTPGRYALALEEKIGKWMILLKFGNETHSLTKTN